MKNSFIYANTFLCPLKKLSSNFERNMSMLILKGDFFVRSDRLEGPVTDLGRFSKPCATQSVNIPISRSLILC